MSSLGNPGKVEELFFIRFHLEITSKPTRGFGRNANRGKDGIELYFSYIHPKEANEVEGIEAIQLSEYCLSNIAT